MPTSSPKESTSASRPPIVVVMGHIDHGKTTILDWYRKAKVVDSESGGITQHIGAYEVEQDGKKITFIDTPGHEAFTKIRSRGATVADIAILVIAADEGMKPQTKEALDIIRTSETPFIVAINKTDKPDANPERVRQDLTKEEVLVESYGGKIPAVEVSAKTGKNMDTLLETILLMAEMEDMAAHPDDNAKGVVIETHRDPRRGIVATLLVRDGTLKKQQFIVLGKIVEKIKMLENFLGKPMESAGPSSPTLTAGISHVPQVGDTFHAFASAREAEQYISSLPPQNESPAVVSPSQTATTDGEEKPIFNIVLKADVVGSKEALEQSLDKLQTEAISVRIIRSEIGDINEDDVKLATATKLVTIVGFRVRIDSVVRELAGRANIHILTGDIIYRLLDDIKLLMQEILPAKIERRNIGKIRILKLFKKDGNKQIIGGRVEEGSIRKEAIVDIIRNKTVIGSGTVLKVQKEKNEAAEVTQGSECGLLVNSQIEIREGDTLESFIEEKIKQTL